MSSFLKIASGLLIPLALAGAGCLAEQAGDEAADPGAPERVGEIAEADTPATSSTPSQCTPSTVPGPFGAPLPGPYACAALAGGSTPITTSYPGSVYYPGIGYGQGYYPGVGYGQGYYPGVGYGQGYYPGVGYGQGYYPGVGYGQGYYPGYGQGYPGVGYYPGSGLAAPGPQTTNPNTACGCPSP
jgi:hypothetical protein